MAMLAAAEEAVTTMPEALAGIRSGYAERIKETKSIGAARRE